MKPVMKNLDCRQYAPVDAAKGICHRSKEMVLAEGQACHRFERAPKCRHCRHYLSGQEEYLGTCGAVKSRPMTYPDLSGITCEWFNWKESSRQ